MEKITLKLEAFEVAHVALRAPCKAFQLSFSVRKRPEMSLADEFFLRGIVELGRAGIVDVGRFLGFSAAESMHLASRLRSQGMVLECPGDHIEATNKGRLQVDPDGGLVELELDETRQVYEMCAFSPAPREAAYPWQPEMAVLNRERAADGLASAKASFQDHYLRWREERDAKDTEQRPRKELARINEVTDLGHRERTITAPVVSNLAAASLYLLGSEVDGGRTNKTRRAELVDAVSAAIGSFRNPRDYSEAGRFLQDWDGGFLQVEAESPLAWIQKVAKRAVTVPAEIAPAVPIAQATTSVLGARLEALEAILNESGEDKDSEAPIFWSLPEGDSWRATSEIPMTFDKLRQTYRLGDLGIVALPRCDETARRRFGPTYGLGRSVFPFDNAIILPETLLPGSLELILRPGLWAAAIIHAVTDRLNYPVPVGVLSAQPRFCENLADFLAHAIGNVRVEDAVAVEARRPKSGSASERLIGMAMSALRT